MLGVLDQWHRESSHHGKVIHETVAPIKFMGAMAAGFCGSVLEFDQENLYRLAADVFGQVLH
jgi:hypothetical protein